MRRARTMTAGSELATEAVNNMTSTGTSLPAVIGTKHQTTPSKPTKMTTNPVKGFVS